MRPDDLLLTPPDGPHMVINGTVVLLEPAGGESHVYVTAPGLSEMLTVRVAGLPAVTEGGSIALYAAQSAIHPFNAGTGQRTG